MTNFQLPRRSPLRSTCSLWQSAYHLIHPRHEISGDNPDPHAFPDPRVLPGLPRGNDRFLDYTKAFNPVGVEETFRVDATHQVTERCSKGLNCWRPDCPKCVVCDEDGNPLPPESPEPTVDEDGNEVPPCPPLMDIIKRPTLELSLGKEFQIPGIYGGLRKSTFNLGAFNLWDEMADHFLQYRDCKIEQNFVSGSGLYNQNGEPIDGGCWENAEVLSECPVPVDIGFAMIEEALSGCLCGDAGMIHTTPGICTFLDDKIMHDVVDYGDGMGPRYIKRTKCKGNVVVSGSGYCGPCGPMGETIEDDGSVWIYGSSFVYMVWDHPFHNPGRPSDEAIRQYRENGDGKLLGEQLQQAFIRETNDIELMVEQKVGTVVESCCLYAVKVVPAAIGCPPC